MCKDFKVMPVWEKMERELAEPLDYDASLTTNEGENKEGWVEVSLTTMQPKKISARPLQSPLVIRTGLPATPSHWLQAACGKCGFGTDVTMVIRV